MADLPELGTLGRKQITALSGQVLDGAGALIPNLQLDLSGKDLVGDQLNVQVKTDAARDRARARGGTPRRVTALVAHEPPLIPVLADVDAAERARAGVRDAYEAGGSVLAWRSSSL